MQMRLMNFGERLMKVNRMKKPPVKTLRAELSEVYYYFSIEISSTSKISVEPGPILAPACASPYARSAGT